MTVIWQKWIVEVKGFGDQGKALFIKTSWFCRVFPFQCQVLKWAYVVAIKFATACKEGNYYSIEHCTLYSCGKEKNFFKLWLILHLPSYVAHTYPQYKHMMWYAQCRDDIFSNRELQLLLLSTVCAKSSGYKPAKKLSSSVIIPQCFLKQLTIISRLQLWCQRFRI